MNDPWSILGWAALALCSGTSLLILAFVAWVLVGRAVLSLRTRQHFKRRHEETRLTPPAEGQTWVSAKGERLTVVYVGQMSIHVRIGVVELFIDPPAWQEMIDRNGYALRAP